MADSISPVSTGVLPATMRVVAPVRPVDSTSSARDGNSSGKPAPESGEDLPPSVPATKQSLATAVEHLNEILRTAERRVRFRIDESSGKTLIFVVNPATGEIVRRIPEEQVLALGRRFGVTGAIIDAEV